MGLVADCDDVCIDCEAELLAKNRDTEAQINFRVDKVSRRLLMQSALPE